MLVLCYGRFGTAVAERIAAKTDAEVAGLPADASDAAALVGQAAFVVAAVGHGAGDRLTALDQVCHRWGVPWSSATLNGTTLEVGPVVVPGAGACFTCYRRRSEAHSLTLERDRAVAAALKSTEDDGTDVGPVGFVPPMVAMAAAALMLDAADPRKRTGRFRHIDVLTGDVLDSAVVRVHGCATCGPLSAVPSARFTAHLVPALEALPW